MSDFRDFLNMLRGRAPDGKSLSISLQPGGFTTELASYRRPSYPQSDTSALQEAMTRNELVFACLAVKATAALDPRLLVQKAVTRGGKTTYEELPGHPLRRLLMRPNPDMTEADLMQAALVSWDVSNPRRFYLEKVYKSGLLTELYPLNPACMRPIYSRADRSIIGYEWNDGTYRREYALDDLIIRSAPAWYEPSPTVAAMGAVDSDSAQTDYVRAFFANGGVPSGVLKYKTANLSQPQRDDIREKWRATYGNRTGRQHDIGVLDADVDYQEIGAPLDKLQSEVMRSIAESRICMVFGVPPLIIYSYIGLTRATYSNLREAWRSFWESKMSPEFKRIRSFVTMHILPEFEDMSVILSEQVRLSWDMSTVAAYQDDIDAMYARAEKAFRAGGITLNQYRELLGQPPDDAGDYYLRLSAYAPYPAGMVPTVTSEDVLAGKTPGGAPTNDPGTEPPPIPPKEGRMQYAPTKARDSASIQTIERRMEKKLAVYLQQQYKRAADAVGG